MKVKNQSIPLHNNLRHLRQVYGYQTKQLALEIGTSQWNITAWETSRCRPSFEMLIKLSMVYGITIDSMIRIDLVEIVSEPLKLRGAVLVNFDININ